MPGTTIIKYNNQVTVAVETGKRNSHVFVLGSIKLLREKRLVRFDCLACTLCSNWKWRYFKLQQLPT